MYELIKSTYIPAFFSLWIFFDAWRRNHKKGKWTIGIFFLTPFVVPYYFAQRNLKRGESRTGGTSWHVLRNFAIYWSLFMLFFTFFSDLSELRMTGASSNQAFGFFKIAMIWGIPAVGTLLLGIFLRNPMQVQHGPTGALVKEKRYSKV